MRQGEAVSQRARLPSIATDGVDPFVDRWIRGALAGDPPRARSLIVTVWGDALAPHGGVVWLAGLIRLMAPFGINERLVRTSVFRLIRDGWLAAQAKGRRSRYRLTREGNRRFEHAYARIYTAPNPNWDGEWELVLAPPESASPRARAKLRDEVAWEGFGAFAPGVYARPLHGDSVLPAIIAALRLKRSVTVVRARDDEALGAKSLAAHAHAAWNLGALAADYRRFIARFGDVIDIFRRAGGNGDPTQCFVVRTLLIHAYRRALLRDPRLPPALLPADWPGAAAFELCRDFYRVTHRRAELHLARTLALDGEALPLADAAFYRRFGGLD